MSKSRFEPSGNVREIWLIGLVSSSVWRPRNARLRVCVVPVAMAPEVGEVKREEGGMSDSTTEVYEGLTGAKEVEAREARNGLRHATSLTMTKLADGLIDPKLVLSWLGGALGVPAGIVGLFVPIREAGALLPQIVLAGRVQAMRHRKWAWVAGSAGQGICAALIVLAALTLSGWVAGVAMALALGGLAVSRSFCSVSFKDILGKTVGKTRRGAVTGAAAARSVVVWRPSTAVFR